MELKMKKEENDFDLILKVLQRAGQPLSILQIKAQLGVAINDKTLLRRLNKLAAQEKVRKIGKTKGVTYELILREETDAQIPETGLPSLSPESITILHLISRPEAHRTPVGYKREFLESYKPNVTGYLSEAERERLAHAGKTARQDEPAGTYARDILQRLLIDLSWNSSRLEGNTYSLLDTERLISMGEVADGKPSKDTQMILNHKDTIEFIIANSEEIGFNRYTLLNIHGLLSNNLLPDPAASGRLRTFGVGIQRSVYIPSGIPQVIEEMFDRLLDTVNRIHDPFEQAFFMMVHLPYLQPFEDVNKRVSRLAANISLNKKNLVPISFVGVPHSIYIKGTLAVYEMNRVELLKDVFLWAYEWSSARYSALRQSIGEPDAFRLQYREAIRSLLFEIVSQGLPYKETKKLIKRTVTGIRESDQSKFTEAVETELMSLHPGNIARFGIRPSEFERWKNVWLQRG